MMDRDIFWVLLDAVAAVRAADSDKVKAEGEVKRAGENLAAAEEKHRNAMSALWEAVVCALWDDAATSKQAEAG